ncbi:hypothetical protein CHU98_g11448 [Xylaria longipes]|nr:hypothetical protein CHU98_g11448 [Xylaria longipes]
MSSNNSDEQRQAQPPPETTFDGILTKIDHPPEKPKKRPSILKRAGTFTRQVMIGPNLEERTSGSIIEKAFDAMEERARDKRAAEEKAAEKAAEKLRNFQNTDTQSLADYLQNQVHHLRHVVLCQGKSPRMDDLYDLAEYEGVYLDPRPNAKNRFKGDNLTHLELASWVVARVAGPMSDGKYKGRYFFLGRNKCMYTGRNQLGADSIQLPLEDEAEFGDIRELARAYYGLCD